MAVQDSESSTTSAKDRESFQTLSTGESATKGRVPMQETQQVTPVAKKQGF
jgi:hypothetical protein